MTQTMLAGVSVCDNLYVVYVFGRTLVMPLTALHIDHLLTKT